MAKKREIKRVKPAFKITGCYFCQEDKEPDYKNIADLEKFTTDRGKIIARFQTGVCQKHQRVLACAIKRARFLATLPFVAQV